MFYRNNRPDPEVSCAAICASRGAACINAYNEGEPDVCSVGAMLVCDESPCENACQVREGDSVCECGNASSGTGGSGGSGGIGGGGTGGLDCTTPGAFDIAGVFEERFNCDENGTCVDPELTSYILIRPDPADTDDSNGTDYTFCDTPETGVLCHQEESGELSWSGSGTLCGDVFAWTATAPENYNEAGFWRFADNGDTFVKTSQYMYIGGGGGECTGTASRVGSPPDPAPIGGCP